MENRRPLFDRPTARTWRQMPNECNGLKRFCAEWRPPGGRPKEPSGFAPRIGGMYVFGRLSEWDMLGIGSNDVSNPKPLSYPTDRIPND